MKKNRIILTGDLHAQIDRLLWIDDSEMTKDDIVIVLGDFGLVWYDRPATIKQLEMLGEKKFTTAFVDGNHENFSLIKKLEKLAFWKDGYIGVLPGNVLHLMRGEIYNINGKRIGVCGGANSADKSWRTENVSWWAAEEITDEDVENFKANLFNGDERNNKIDIMLSHTCPTEIFRLATLYSVANGRFIKPNKSEIQLEKINQMAQVDKWYFGHWHLDMKFDDKYECLYYSKKEI